MAEAGSFQSPYAINSPEPGLKVASPIPGEPMINQLFRTVMLHKGSDLHLKVGTYPMMRLRGTLVPATEEKRLDHEDMVAIVGQQPTTALWSPTVQRSTVTCCGTGTRATSET